ncbi:hypothetical protein [Burkholderia multivorans]|uniref:hypothetical protein n=1 Tax=Burkholderia multivorans TaxID=87883 RepID=UPI001C241438|nr:hypothetical protein [Burkholderia multivorans]MBU9312908.1 hypothetical protein [Burkholderia multivorans]
MARVSVQPVDLLDMIKYVAKEQGFKISDMNGSSSKFDLYINRHHGVAFRVSQPSDYIQVHQWEDNTSEYGRAVYSIRSHSDAIQFCNILIASAGIRAKRKQ